MRTARKTEEAASRRRKCTLFVYRTFASRRYIVGRMPLVTSVKRYEPMARVVGVHGKFLAFLWMETETVSFSFPTDATTKDDEETNGGTRVKE